MTVAALDDRRPLDHAHSRDAGAVFVRRLLGRCRKRAAQGHSNKSNP
ncbi:MAG: DUF2384 domain-containing protein [Candidatus Eremiobacteraeota bacterium]|nr:DUF2384 domain-containing protein [Candidatus Eremiobacteraeota bacterium]